MSLDLQTLDTIELDTNLLIEVGLSRSFVRAPLVSWLRATEADAPLCALHTKNFERFVPFVLRLHTL